MFLGARCVGAPMEKRKITVITYNIHKGFNIGNRSFVLREMREAIRSVHADMVFLQEVIGHHDKHHKQSQDWPTQPQFEYLADTIWPHTAYGKNAVYTSGHHGNAILSKYPLSFWENIDISTNRLEKRGLLHGIMEIPHKRKPLHAICVHLGLLETERQSQVKRICERIDSLVPHDEPLIIAGDFNDWRMRVSPELEKRVAVNEVFKWLLGTHARTFPSWLPTLRLDRIYYRGMQAVKGYPLVESPWNQLSDHVALCAELIF
jgi:endonuclease/exonuclease/phosphatase family metal-dependent hydrolase